MLEAEDRRREPAQPALQQTALLPGRSDTPYYLQSQLQTPSSAAPALTLEPCLQRGEAVLWAGGTDPAAWWQAQRAAIVVLPLLIPAAIGIFLAARSRWSPLGQAPVVAARPGAGVPSGACAVPAVEERPLAESAGMRLEKLQNGVSTIVFERHSPWVWHGQGGHKETCEYSFQGIADAEAVFRRIAAARAAGKSPQT